MNNDISFIIYNSSSAETHEFHCLRPLLPLCQADSNSQTAHLFDLGTRHPPSIDVLHARILSIPLLNPIGEPYFLIRSIELLDFLDSIEFAKFTIFQVLNPRIKDHSNSWYPKPSLIHRCHRLQSCINYWGKTEFHTVFLNDIEFCGLHFSDNLLYPKMQWIPLHRMKLEYNHGTCYSWHLRFHIYGSSSWEEVKLYYFIIFCCNPKWKDDHHSFHQQCANFCLNSIQ